MIKVQHCCRHHPRGAVRRSPEAAAQQDGVHQSAVDVSREDVLEDALSGRSHARTTRYDDQPSRGAHSGTTIWRHCILPGRHVPTKAGLHSRADREIKRTEWWLIEIRGFSLAPVRRGHYTVARVGRKFVAYVGGIVAVEKSSSGRHDERVILCLIRYS